jgi:hypothetical protein
LLAGWDPGGPPCSTFSVDASLARPACGLARHLHSASGPDGGSHSSRCRSRPRVSRFFAVTASTAIRLAWLVSSSIDGPALATDPLRPSAEGAPPGDAISDALCRPDGATARAPPLAFAAGAHTLRRAPRFPPRPGPDLPPRRLERGGLIDPGRLPPTRSPISRSRDASAHSLLRSRASASHPFVRRGVAPPCRGQNLRCVLPHASSVRLSAPLGEVRKMLLADFCNRLTTRAPVDHPALERVGLRLADHRRLEPEPATTVTPARLAATRPRVERA